MTKRRSKLMLVISVCIVIIVALAVAWLIAARSANTSTAPVVTTADELRYLPLGDSYTIGQSVAEDQRWPDQLVAAYRPAGKRLVIVANPAVTGYTTQDLIDRELPLVTSLRPDFVSVQIGVNDYVQGVDIQTFTTHLDQIISAVQAALPVKKNIVLVTIPDYAKTPAGARYGDPTEATAEIARFNQVIKKTGATYGLPVADVYEISQRVSQDQTLTADDGLHPSGIQYRLWTEVIQRQLEQAGIPAAE